MDNLESVFPELVNDNYRLNSDIELGNSLTLVAAYINAASYRFLKLLAEFDRRKCWVKDGSSCCSQWLNWKCGISRSAAREKLRMAHCLENLPEINEAFAKGELSYSKVRAMTRIATDDNENDLLGMAKNNTADHVDMLARRHQPVDEKQQPIPAVDEQQLRRVDFYLKDGMWLSRNESEGPQLLFLRSGGMDADRTYYMDVGYV